MAKEDTAGLCPQNHVSPLGEDSDKFYSKRGHDQLMGILLMGERSRSQHQSSDLTGLGVYMLVGHMPQSLSHGSRYLSICKIAEDTIVCILLMGKKQTYPKPVLALSSFHILSPHQINNCLNPSHWNLCKKWVNEGSFL